MIEDLSTTRDRVTRVEATLDGVRGAVESLHTTVRDMSTAIRGDLVRLHERIDERHDETIAQASQTADHARSIEWLRQREAAREDRATRAKAWALRSLWAGVVALATWVLGQAPWRLWQ